MPSNDDNSPEIETVDEEEDFSDGTDWLLRAIIKNYSQSGYEIGVTLTVGGSVISGLLISGRSYFAELAKMLVSNSVSEDDIFAELADDLGGLGAEIYDKPTDAPDDWQQSPITFIHLKGARFHAPGHAGIPLKDGFLWRGKLASIDAFSIGSFVVGDSDTN